MSSELKQNAFIRVQGQCGKLNCATFKTQALCNILRHNSSLMQATL